MKQKLGQTEVIMDNLNPEFIKEIVVDYYFEMEQRFIVEVYDVDDANNVNNLKNQEFIGHYEFVLGSLVSSRNQCVTGSIKNSIKGKKNMNSTVTIHADEKREDQGK